MSGLRASNLENCNLSPWLQEYCEYG